MSEERGRKIIVIYEKSTGRIKGVKRTGNIKRRSELSDYCGGIPHGELGFTFEPRGVEIDLENDRCYSVINGEPKMVFGKDGLAKFQRVMIEEAQKGIQICEGIFIDPRPGIGDFILGAECAAGIMGIYPEKKIAIGGQEKYRELCFHLNPKIEFGGSWGDGLKFKNYFYVDQRVGYQFDPRGGLHGHVSKYGVYLGEENLKGSVQIDWEPGERGEILKELEGNFKDLKFPVLGIHIKSASSLTRSWFKDEAYIIAQRWKNEFEGDVILFGERKDYRIGGDGFWIAGVETGVMGGAALVGICDLMICIDSGPMHLARIQGIKSLCLWGGTRPGIVLGREISNHDIIGDVGCGFQSCHSCTKKRIECMESISAEVVWKKLEEVKDGYVL
jgi:hypothetical protein